MNGHYHPYVQAAIDGEVARLACAQTGERNNILFRAAAALASLQLGEGEILRHLKPAAEGVGIRGSELYSTVKSGVRTGTQILDQFRRTTSSLRALHRSIRKSRLNCRSPRQRVLETTSPSSSVAVMAARPFQTTKIGGTYTDATELRFG